MTDRTTLVIPADRVDGLDIPPVALDTGEPDPVWVDLPTRLWAFRRGDFLRLPLSPARARRAGWRSRVIPYLFVAIVVLFLASMSTNGYGAEWFGLRVGLQVGALALALLAGRGVVAQVPWRQHRGGLRLAAVPVEVARLWQEANPGVEVTTGRAPRRYPRRFYALSGPGLLLAAILGGVLLGSDGRENPPILFTAVTLLFMAGLWVTSQVLPPGYVRFGEPAGRRER